jgi:Flp pilus assembly CpaF family ATPase
VVPEINDQEARQAANLERLAGPLVRLIQDPAALDVVVNADGDIWTNRLGAGWACAGEFPTASARLLLQGIAKMREIPLNHANPILETVFPLTGDRIEGLIAPIVDGAVMAVRSRQKQVFRARELKAAGVLTNAKDPANSRRHHDDFHVKARELDDRPAGSGATYSSQDPQARGRPQSPIR